MYVVCQDGMEKEMKAPQQAFFILFALSCLPCKNKSVMGVDCVVVEWVKCGALRWSEHVIRRNEDN